MGSHLGAGRSDYAGRMLRVSVVMPCHNGEPFLDEALRSIAAQTRPPHEVIVVDDGSTDRSAEIAARHGATVIRQPCRGDGAARNAGIRAASGDVVASLDADDRWLPHHLERVCALLEDHPDAAAAFGAVQQFGDRSEYIRGWVPEGAPVMLVEAAFKDWLHTTIGSIVRREALERIGGFDERERFAKDFDLWLRLARTERFVATHEVTAEYRRHASQMSARRWKQMAAVYRYRRAFVDRLVADGDRRGRHFERLLTRVWLKDLRRYLRLRDRRTVLTLLAATPLVRPWTGLRRPPA